jgi:hypothetical protein
LRTSTAAATRASLLVRDLLVGPVRRAEVVATGPMATYLDVDGRFLAVVAAGGVRLPCAVVLGPGVRPPAGPDLAVGDGHIAAGSWFDPRVLVGPVDPVAVERLATELRRRSGEDPLLPADAVDDLAGALRGGDLDSAVAALVGRGSGLTPAGDDLLAGALAALRAVGSAVAGERLAAAVRRWAPGRTTRLSLALLDAAAVGAMIPEAEAVLRALSRPTPPDQLDRALDQLVSVGHTSGWHLAAGLLVGAASPRCGVERPFRCSEAAS